MASFLACCFSSIKKARLAAGSISESGPLLEAAGTTFTRLGFVDAQVTAHEVEAVEGFDGFVATGLHFHETETARTAGFTVLNDTCGGDFAIFGKKVVKIRIGRGPGKVAYENVLGQGKNLKLKNET